MGEQDDAEKTEEPTEKKLQDAREKGDVPQSKDVSSLFLLVGGTLIFFVMSAGMARSVLEASLPFVERSHQMSFDGDALRNLTWDVAGVLAFGVGLPICILLVFAVSGHLVQNGLVIAIERIKPKFSKLNPLSGIKNLVSLKNFVEFIKSVLKLLLVGGIMYLVVAPELTEVGLYTELSLIGILEKYYELAGLLLLVVMSIMALIAAADFAYQKYEFNKKMRMSLRDIKDEMKQTDGSPEVKARIRQIRMERAQQRMISSVPDADVVVTNPTHFAVALKYDMEGMVAPVCVAKGQDLIALKIREVAEENDVTVVENPPVARALYATVEIDQQIPPEHYQAVAQIISYVYRLKKKFR